MSLISSHAVRQLIVAGILLCGLALAPDIVLAQSSPFQTGATALQTNILTLLTPIAAIVIMVLGIVAATGRISWGWPITAVVGIAVMFGAPQIVAWTRGMFGV
jgi:type IV secretion system protein VirB2